MTLATLGYIQMKSSLLGQSRLLNALAYTLGTDIVFDKGQYQPNTIEGRRLLAHELTQYRHRMGVE